MPKIVIVKTSCRIIVEPHEKYAGCSKGLNAERFFVGLDQRMPALRSGCISSHHLRDA